MSLCLVMLGSAFVVAEEPATLRPCSLRCEYLVTPLAVGTRLPRLSWEVSDPRRGARQTAYQVLVAGGADLLEPGKADLWDSGRVASSESAQIVYGGRPLRSEQRCYWRVRLWDGDGAPGAWSETAFWGMGLLERSDWRAQWISDPTPAADFAPAHNGYHSQLAPTAQETKWVQIHLGAARTFDRIRLHPARPYDWVQDVPGFLFALRFRVIVSDREDGEGGRVVLDRTAEDEPNPGAEARTYEFAAVTGRYVRLVTERLRQRTGSPEFGLALAEMEVLRGEENLSRGAHVSASDSVEQGGWSRARLTDGDTTSHPARGMPALPAPMLRKEFTVGGAIVRATLSITARGCYEARISGKRVGDQILAPEWTDYHKRIQYQTYDVAGLLRGGEANALAVQLGDGWYAGRIGLSGLDPSGRARGFYGRTPQLLTQLRVVLADGTEQLIATDETWRSSLDGPIRSSDILDGEVQDLRRTAPGWDLPGFDDTGWSSVTVRPLDDTLIVAQPNEPIRVVEDLAPLSLTEPQPGVWVFDLGQNMPGWVRLRVRGQAGETVVLHHAEALDPATGTAYTANLRGAPQVDSYTLSGDGEETLEPHLTYHGFRYVQVTGLSTPPKPEGLVGRAFCSSSPVVGSFECSSPLLNRLWTNILWTQRANLMSVPTDCPQRDERLGWMGDAGIFCQTGILNMDLAGFLTKWVPDIRDAQARDGRFPDFAPDPFDPDARFSGAPGWADAGVTVPWRAWVNYGDRRMLEEHYEAAKRWVEHVRERNPDLLWLNDRQNDYNDWLNGDTLVLEGWPRSGGAVPNEVFATAQFARSTQTLARMAEVIGRLEDAEHYRALFEAIRAAFVRAYADADGRIRGDTQAGYAVALHFGLLPDDARPKAVEHLVEGIARYGGHLSTGIHATLPAMMELSRSGRTDLACELVNARTRPSWGYMIDSGATTIWERWDGYVEGRGFQDPGMNSLNHWAFGSVGEWLYRVVLGLNPLEEGPGWQRFEVSPQPGGGITWARGSYHSIRGPIEVSWRIEGARFLLDVTVPVGSEAVVRIPTRDPASVRESGTTLEPVAPGEAVYRIGSGAYHFEAASPAP